MACVCHTFEHRNLNMNNSISEAIKYAKTATEADRSKNYFEAIKLYQYSVEILRQNLEQKTNLSPANRNILLMKCHEYEDRVIKLRYIQFFLQFTFYNILLKITGFLFLVLTLNARNQK